MARKGENWLRKNRKAVFSGAFVLAVTAMGYALVSSGALTVFEQRILDFRFLYFNQGFPASEDIVYLDIDEESLQTLSPQIGGWPWPRGSVMGEHVIDYIMRGEPAILLLDVLYTEYSPKTPDVDIPEEDLALVDFSLLYPEVSHAALFSALEHVEEPEPLPDSAAVNFEIPVDASRSTLVLPPYNASLLPFDPLYAYAGRLHLVNHLEDSDGVSRNYDLLYLYQGKYYPSLAFAALWAKLGARDLRIEGQAAIMTLEDGSELRIPLMKEGYFQLDFYRSLDQFTAYPIDNIIASSMNLRAGEGDLLVPYTDFKGKVVVIGASATGLKDLKITPMGENVPGPYLHITALSNMLQGQYLTPVSPLATLLVIFVSVTAIVLMTLFLKNGVIKNTVGFVYVVLLVALSLLLFRYGGIVVDVADVLVSALVSFFGALIFLSLTEGAERNRIHNAMGKYLAPSVMQEILEHYENLSGEVGEKREIAVLFSDIRSFTTVSEHLRAETVVYLLNRYLASMIDIVFEYRGTLDKMIGDAIMAFWGAPQAEERKEYLAVKTGLSMIHKLGDVNRSLVEEQLPSIKIGVGVNTGDMIVGNIGSEKRLDYTAIGDNVNLGSRLEGLTKYYRTPILVSSSTYERTKDEFVYVFVDTVAVKGKETGIAIYAPLAERTPDVEGSLRAEIAQFDAGHELYLAQKFQEARPQFQAMEGDLPSLGGLASVFAERCVALLAEPPGALWSGTWKMVDK
jgi:adenylate cyclase